jgi:hypothetical protein
MTDYFTTEKRTTNEKKAYGKIIFSIDWLIDWFLTPTLAVFQLYCV